MKKTMKCTIASLIIMAAGAVHAQVTDGGFTSKQQALMVVLDISGSMNGKNINQVRSTLANAANKVPPGTPAGLVTFSGCSAGDVQTKVPLKGGTIGQVVSAANAARPRGSTDIYRGLLKAEQEINSLGNNYCVKVLILTDGFDNCGFGEYKAVAKRITSKNECTSINAISIGTVEWDADVIDEITSIGKGKSQHVTDASEVEEAVRDALEAFNEEETDIQWEGDFSGGQNGNPGSSIPNPNQPGKPGEQKVDVPREGLGLENEEEIEMEKGKKKNNNQGGN